MTTITVEEHLRVFLELHGEAAWQAEIQRLVLAALRTGISSQEAYWRELTKGYDWLDWDQLKQQAQAADTPNAERLIAEALKSQMPGIKSQAQYDAVAGAMEAMRLLVNALLEQDSTREHETRRALDLALDAIRVSTELTSKLEEVPEAATSQASQAFKETPRQYEESHVFGVLNIELDALRTRDELGKWYADSKAKMDRIVTQRLRNELFDSIRAKRNQLEQ